jgi:membrane fusion protein, heavy metal efflux system
MKKIYLFLGIAYLNLFSAHSFAAIPVGCLIEPERIAELGSQVIGVADKVLVERGDQVKKGQILATLRSEIEQANVNAAKTRSQLIAEVRTAEANLDLARITEKRSISLVERKFISQQALDKSHAETEVASHRLTFSREQLRLADDDLKVANAQLNVRAIRAPFDGIVAERYIWPGERVEEKPLFRIIKTNPLRVEMVAPVALFGTIAKNDFVTITPELPNLQQLEAKVTLVDKMIDGASNTFRIRAEIANPNFDIPSGLRCKVAFNTTIDEVTTSDKVDTKKSLGAVNYQPATADLATSKPKNVIATSPSLALTHKLNPTNKPSLMAEKKPSDTKQIKHIKKSTQPSNYY